MKKLSISAILFILSCYSTLSAEEAFTLQSGRQPGQIDRVHVLLEVGGEVKKPGSDGEQSEKISVVCDLSYDEKTFEVPAGSSGSVRSLRSYEKAEAKRRIGSQDSQPGLQPEHKLLAVEAGEDSAKIFSPRGPLTLEELELVEVIGNSLLLDRFLPEKAVKVGEKWGISEKVLAPFLGWDVAEKSEVECTLKEVTEAVARFELSGKVTGAVNGVKSEMKIKARFRFDRRRRRIDWWAMLAREERGISFVEGGLDVVSRLQITVAPQEEAPALAEDAVQDLPTRSTPELLQLTEKVQANRLEITHDRQWHLYHDLQDMAVLRRVVKGELTVQCNLRCLPESRPEKIVSLEQFQEEIRKGLGGSFGGFDEAAQRPEDEGRRVLKVLVRGVAKSKDPPPKDSEEPLELPMRWIYYHVADARGRQAVIVFTLEEKYFDQFRGGDETLVGSLKFLDPPPTKKDEG